MTRKGEAGKENEWKIIVLVVESCGWVLRNLSKNPLSSVTVVMGRDVKKQQLYLKSQKWSLRCVDSLPLSLFCDFWVQQAKSATNRNG